jgi:hypothetical protein
VSALVNQTTLSDVNAATSDESDHGQRAGGYPRRVLRDESPREAVRWAALDRGAKVLHGHEEPNIAVRFKADHLVREPLEHLTAEGFAIDELQRSKLGIVERVAARKPA